MVRPMKSPNMMSITGRMPVIAAPTAMPVNPASEIGVSSTRSAPNSSTRPVSTLNGWPASAMSSPRIKTLGSRRISSARASRMACASVSSRVATASPPLVSGPLFASSIDILIHLVGAGIRSIERELHGAIDLSLHFVMNFVEGSAIGRTLRQQPLPHDAKGIAIGLPLLLFLFRAIVFAAHIADVVPVVSIGVHQQQGRTFACTGALHQLLGRCVHGAHILAVHRF